MFPTRPCKRRTEISNDLGAARERNRTGTAGRDGRPIEKKKYTNFVAEQERRECALNSGIAQTFCCRAMFAGSLPRKIANNTAGSSEKETFSG